MTLSAENGAGPQAEKSGKSVLIRIQDYLYFLKASF
jgi:hypothetical protein